MDKIKIFVRPSCFAPGFEMIISVPKDRDTEEYIDELLDGILNEDIKYNIEWNFVETVTQKSLHSVYCASTSVKCSFCQPGPCGYRREL